MRKRANVIVFSWVVSSAVLPSRATLAQEKDAITETARRRFQEGVKFFDRKRFEDARAAFLQAYALKHHPTVLLNLGQSEIQGGHWLEAARHFSAFLRESSNASPRERVEGENGLAAARSKLGRIAVSATAGAEVLVDGEPMGDAPLPDAVDVAPGTHTVEAKLAGQTRTASVSVLVGESVSATLSLASETPVAVAPAPAPSSDATASPPLPQVSESPPATAGTQENVPSSTAPNVQVSPDGREPFFKWLGHHEVGIFAVGLTGIGIGVFVGFEFAAKDASTSAHNLSAAIRNEAMHENIKSADACDPVAPGFGNACDTLRDNLNKRDTDRTLATVGVVAAGVGLTATIAGYFMTSNSSTIQRSQAVAMPVVGPQRVGLAVVSSF